MNAEELITWCSWFWNPVTHACGCGWWAGGEARRDERGRTCPALRDGNPKFVPEPIRGDPLGKDIIFLAANPGGGTRRPPSVELESCPWWDSNENTWTPVLESSHSFVDFNLTSNVRAAADREWCRKAYAKDRVSRAATGILALVAQEKRHDIAVLPRVDTNHFTNNIGKVALLNVIHCKSPGFPSGANCILQDGGCGRQSWMLLSRLRPRTVVAFGAHVRTWYALLSNTREPAEGDRTPHKWPSGSTTVFHWLHHPQGLSYSQRNGLADRLR